MNYSPTHLGTAAQTGQSVRYCYGPNDTILGVGLTAPAWAVEGGDEHTRAIIVRSHAEARKLAASRNGLGGTDGEGSLDWIVSPVLVHPGALRFI